MTETTSLLQAKLAEFRNSVSIVPELIEKEYTPPSLSLLKEYRTQRTASNLNPRILEAKLREFGFEGTVEDIKVGPVVTRYEVRFGSGVRLSQVRNISEDLAVALMSNKVRIIAPIPGTSKVGIEIRNEKKETIGLREIMRKAQESKAEIPIALGTDTVGNPAVFDLAEMPHLLIAGQTGSGKSVSLNTIILSVIYMKKPEECQLILVDPKRVEMTSYADIPHLKYPVLNEASEALDMFKKLVDIMEDRFVSLARARVRNIKSFNETQEDKMPYIVVVVDEMSDLIMTSDKELEYLIVRLAQKSRAVGIHLVLATQKPIVKVITGLIKSNMPSRIAFQVASKSDSRVILDCNGAENLEGKGDMLIIHPGSSDPERFHGAWVSDEEITNVAEFIKGE